MEETVQIVEEHIPQQKSKNNKKKIIITVISCVIGFIIGFCVVFFITYNPVKDKLFVSNGMSITLTNRFAENEYVTYTSVYTSKDVAVFSLQETFVSGISSNYTLNQYADIIKNNNGLTCETNQSTGCVYFDFVRVVGGKEMFYRAYCYKTSNSYWLIQFACENAKQPNLIGNIQSWANTITFVS